jgi:peptidoglycan/xylan/chitin deacetylase (PgdA/CDA1 family)
VTRNVRLAAAVLVLAVLAYAAYRLAVHERGVQPAVLTPQMDAQQEISPSFVGHIKRLIHERVTYGDRSNRPKLIALTFDDGPYPIYTPLLLDTLARLHVPATFFLIGRDAQQWPELAQRIERSGNEVADHTYTHPNLDQEDGASVRREIELGASSLYSIVGDDSVRRYFRPPHGRYTVQTIEIAQSLGYHTILWNDDPGDWRSVGPQTLLDHMERHATAPDIVLLHSGKMATIQAVPSLVARFRSAGYRFVTVRQLLAQVPVAEINHPAKHPV